MNLMGNAIKFTEKGSVELRITGDKENKIKFEVIDTGIGISKDHATTVFQMFKRLHTESEYDGTGIGLAICKKIIGHYNGEIWFEGNESGGTTFFFTIRKF